MKTLVKGHIQVHHGLRFEGMREIDKATIFEMQRDVFQQLRHNIFDKRAGLHERDAYEGLFRRNSTKRKAWFSHD